MKVGVFPVVDAHGGGVYQYSLMVLDAMDHLRSQMKTAIAYEGASATQIRAWKSAGWDTFPFGPRTPRTIVRRLIVGTLGEGVAARFGSLVDHVAEGRRGGPGKPAPGADRSIPADRGRERWLRRHGVELMLYPVPTRRSLEAGVPFVMAVHDLQHRLQPEFPEVSADGEWERREQLFTNVVRHAEAIVVDSEIGKEDVLEFYGHLTSSDRVHVLPFAPPPYLKRQSPAAVAAVLASLEIPGRYLLFPAQFWPHKNHVRVTQAVAELRRQGVDLTVVMTGSFTGAIREHVGAEVRETVDRQGIADLVRIPGFVDDDSMAALYAGASGVILPTFFGPTNIPVIEGWAMDVPVLTSDIRGIREQCGDAAILVDPRSVEAIADGMARLWSDEHLRERLIIAGRDRIRMNDRGAFRDGLGRILSEVAPARATRNVAAAA